MTSLQRVLLVAVAIAVVSVTWLLAERNRLANELGQTEDKLELARGDAGAEIEALERNNNLLTGQLDEATTALERTEAQLDAATDELTTQLDAFDAATERADAYQRAVGDLDQLVPMPDLLGRGVEDAEEFAKAHGAVLKIEIADPSNIIALPGAIIEQLPAVNTVILAGSVIWIQVYVPGS
jgi:hypothetical protein